VLPWHVGATALVHALPGAGLGLRADLARPDPKAPALAAHSLLDWRCCGLGPHPFRALPRARVAGRSHQGCLQRGSLLPSLGPSPGRRLHPRGIRQFVAHPTCRALCTRAAPRAPPRTRGRGFGAPAALRAPLILPRVERNRILEATICGSHVKRAVHQHHPAIVSPVIPKPLDPNSVPLVGSPSTQGAGGGATHSAQQRCCFPCFP
jgi:hypothetical protein